MNILIIFESKFKTNMVKIEDILHHYGLRKIQNTTYTGKLSKKELEEIRKEFDAKINERESVLIVPVCESCYSKKESFGRELKFSEDLFRVF